MEFIFQKGDWTIMFAEQKVFVNIAVPSPMVKLENVE